MTYRPRVVKRPRRPISWKIILPVFLLVALSVYVGIVFLLPKEEPVGNPGFTICNKSLSETQAIFAEMDFPQTTEMADYLIYGETLNIYGAPYDILTPDPFVGKTAVIRNICDGYEWVYMLEKTVDGKIPLELLPEGFYEIFVVEDLERKRLYSTETLSDIFYPVRRYESLKKVTLLADKTLVKDKEEQALLDKNYVFIQVENIAETAETEDIVDVYIDPAHSTWVYNNIDRGRTAFNLTEASETLRIALLLRDKLEAKGLNVALARADGEEVIDLYGTDGRLYKAYQGQAKYYIELNMNYTLNADIRGSRIIYSSYASNKFATAIFKSFMETEGVEVYGKANKSNIAGVVAASRFEGLDSYPVIREAGGRILSAGMISELAKSQNASFVEQERQGMQAVSLELIFISNEEDTQVFMSQIDQMAENIASGIVKYLDLDTP